MKKPIKLAGALAATLFTIGSFTATTLAMEEPAQIPLDVDNVVSGGWWKEGDKEGYLRFCAFQRGHEHVSHQVVIEWVEETGNPEEKNSIVSRLVVKDIPEVWSIGDATFVRKDDKTFIQFDGTHSYAPYKEAKFSIEIEGVGKAKVTITE